MATSRLLAKGIKAGSRFVGSLGVGTVATAVDFVALVVQVRGVGLLPAHANVPALLAGAVVQFVGNRRLVFGLSGGQWFSQAARFAAAESLALGLNAALFLLLTRAGVPYVLARPVGSFLVFACVSYPLWRLVFPLTDLETRRT